MTKLECAPENAAMMLRWIAERGGVAVWESVNLSNPGASWSTPALADDGLPALRPSWEADNKPARIVTDASEIEVVTRLEVKRFRVAVRRGSQGLMLELTDGAARKVEAAIAEAGEDANYRFDYGTQEAVVTVPDKKVPLSEWSQP